MTKTTGIYIHIPFCKQKCFYCDFTSYCDKNNLMEDYIKCLKKEIQKELKNKNLLVDTIYIGGGTPSILKPEYIKEIIYEINDNSNILDNAEITIEVNPGTVDIKKLESYKKYGINRLSIGLQSANDKLLKQLGRIHNYEQFFKCFQDARKAEFKNINIDLMIGLPNQTIQDIFDSVQKIVNINPEHISVYSLIVEEGTKLYNQIEKGDLVIPEEEFERKMYWMVKESLKKFGYNHYEISNFSKVGYESKHNTNCWNQKEYLGFGVAAHSYFNNIRYSNISNIEEYIKNIDSEEYEKNREIHEIQSEESKQKEYMLLGLRKIDGIDITEFKNKFIQNPIYLFRKELNKLIEKDLIEIDENNIKLTNKGLDLANLVWEEFV